MDDFNDLLSSEEILGGGAGVGAGSEEVKAAHSPTINDLMALTPHQTTNASTGSGKRSNAKDLEAQHQKAIEKFDDGFEDLLQGLQERIELLSTQLRGGNSEIRKPKLPVKVFLRFHMEEYNLVKMRKPEWTTSQITQSLKKRWIGMSDAQKEKYIESYDKDMKKYDGLIMNYARLTQKPKKPLTPYFQFYTEYLPNYKMNYPQLSLNEVTKLIGRDWSNFDMKKKAELNREFERQKVNYAKQVKSYESNSNDYTKVSDYLSKVEDYEKELEEELETLRQKHPKAPSAADLKRKEYQIKLEEARKIRQEKHLQEIRANKANKQQKKELTAVLDKPQLPPSFIKGIPDNAIPRVIQPIAKKAAAPASNAVSKADSQHALRVVQKTSSAATAFDLEQELKDARSINGKQARLRSAVKSEEEPQLRKILRRSDGTGAVKVVATRNSSSVPSKSQTRLQSREQEKKK